MSRLGNFLIAVFIATTLGTTSAQPVRSFGPGTYLVGTDIEPGIYRTEGEVTYYERLSGLSGEFDDIIANEALPEGPVLIEIKDTDAAFHSEGPGEWTIVDDSYQPQTTTSFGPGWWLVGRDISPGLYRTEGEITYLARLSGLSGEFDDIIANEALAKGPVVIEIKESDVAFQAQGDGIWSLIDDSYNPEPRTVFGDGWWIVGVDILPGVYRTPDDVTYYARLSGFGNGFDDIITNEALEEGGSIIEIMDTDVGFQTQGGAVWTRVETTTNVESTTWSHVKSWHRRR